MFIMKINMNLYIKKKGGFCRVAVINALLAISAWGQVISDFETSAPGFITSSSGLSPVGGSGVFWSGSTTNPPLFTGTTLNGPAGAGDDYIYSFDDQPLIGFAMPASATLVGGSFSFDFLNSYSLTPPPAGVLNWADIVITDGTVANSFGLNLIDIPANDGTWHSLSGDFTTASGWRGILSDGNNTLTSVVATQAQLDALLSNPNASIIFGSENLNGGIGSSPPNPSAVNTEIVALDNINFLPVPEPSSFSLVGLGFFAAVLRRRR